jgi:hypothetical protein
MKRQLIGVPLHQLQPTVTVVGHYNLNCNQTTKLLHWFSPITCFPPEILVLVMIIYIMLSNFAEQVKLQNLILNIKTLPAILIELKSLSLLKLACLTIMIKSTIPIHTLTYFKQNNCVCIAIRAGHICSCYLLGLEHIRRLESTKLVHIKWESSWLKYHIKHFYLLHPFQNEFRLMFLHTY